MGEVILHIGTHKTGTTSLQAFLRANRDAFAAEGIGIPYSDARYRSIDKDRNAHFLLRSVIDVIKPHRANDEDPAFIEHGTAALQEALREYPRVLLTDEALWLQGAIAKKFWPELKRQLAGLGAERVKIVLYLRRQDQFISSLWNQFVKGNTRETLALEEYVSKKSSRRAMDYDRGISMLEEQFGRENIVVRPFDRKDFAGGDLYHDFCAAIGCAFSDSLVIPETESNPGLDERFVQIKRIANESPGYREGRNVLMNPAIAAQSASPGKEGSVLGGKAAAELVARYEEGNARIAREYLGREDGVLFAPVDAGEPRFDPGITPSQEDLIRLFAETISHEDARIEALERENAQLRRKLEEHVSKSSSEGLARKVRRKLRGR